MALSLQDALELSSTLAERMAATPPAAGDDLRRKKAMVDFLAFGLFKEASFGKGLAFGAGVGLPLLGAGHLLLRDARHQGEELVRGARNQALLAALGIGGAQALGGTFAGGDALKLSADATASKLAALVLVDEVLCRALEKAGAAEKHDIEECLFVNRHQGTQLLAAITSSL
jgi:hypothetical protein